MKILKVLIACEESQAVCKAFRALGHKAFSCDLQDCSGGHPEWHIKGDVLKVLNLPIWDLVIAHPPCTYLTVAANRYYNEDKYGEKAKRRKGEREQAIKFFMEFANCKCKRVAIENQMLQEPKTPTKEQIRLVRRNLSDYVNSQFSCLHIDTRNMLIYEIITEWEKIRGG